MKHAELLELSGPNGSLRFKCRVYEDGTFSNTGSAADSTPLHSFISEGIEFQGESYTIASDPTEFWGLAQYLLPRGLALTEFHEAGGCELRHEWAAAEALHIGTGDLRDQSALLAALEAFVEMSAAHGTQTLLLNGWEQWSVRYSEGRLDFEQLAGDMPPDLLRLNCPLTRRAPGVWMLMDCGEHHWLAEPTKPSWVGEPRLTALQDQSLVIDLNDSYFRQPLNPGEGRRTVDQWFATIERANLPVRGVHIATKNRRTYRAAWDLLTEFLRQAQHHSNPLTNHSRTTTAA